MAYSQLRLRNILAQAPGVWAWILALIIEGSSLLEGTLQDLFFGWVIYLVNFYLFTAMFPWFMDARKWITIFAHLVFGGLLASSYLLLRRRAVISTPEFALYNT